MPSAKRKAETDVEEGARFTSRVRVRANESKKSLARNYEHPADKLSSLLDCTSLTTHAKMAARFDTIANEILHRYHLRIAVPKADGAIVYTDYEVIELEFYLYMAQYHEDPFTHGSDEQKRSGQWYFHRAPSRKTHSATTLTSDSTPRTATAAGGYRGGTRKGLDLTMGGPVDALPKGRPSKFFPISSPTGTQDPPRGGVLLRSLRRISDHKIISGPSRLVDEVLAANDARTIAELVGERWNGETSALSSASLPSRTGASMYFVPVEVQEELPAVFRSPRIGLDLSHATIPLPSVSVADTLAHPRTLFVSKPYRYFTQPHLLTANGRGQTFFGVYTAFTSSSTSGRSDEKRLLSRVVESTGLKMDAAVKYSAAYRDSKNSGSLASLIGPKGKGAGSSPVAFLRMTGTLERYHSGAHQLEDI